MIDVDLGGGERCKRDTCIPVEMHTISAVVKHLGGASADRLSSERSDQVESPDQKQLAQVQWLEHDQIAKAVTTFADHALAILVFLYRNVAETVVLAFRITVQVLAVPEQAPPQPEKRLRETGVAVSITDWP